jgi:uncharacterized protein (TIGR00290 family)
VTFAVSWSGGKDACLAMHRAGATDTCGALFTVLDEGGIRSRSHGLRVEVLQAHAASLGVPLHTVRASWEGYEAAVIEGLVRLKASGMDAVVFGDIDTDSHKAWEMRVCEAAALEARLPVWREDRQVVLRDFLEAGYEARLVAVREGKLDPALLGRVLDWALIREIEAAGCDPCGEFGEYHTVVTGGPRFPRPLRLVPGARVLVRGVWALDFETAVEG